MEVPVDQVSEAMARMDLLINEHERETPFTVRAVVSDLLALFAEVERLREKVTELQATGTALQTENRALSKKLKESLADCRVVIGETEALLLGLTWIRDLVRAAELLEQRDPHGKIWDDSARRGLETARARGWGNHQIGSLLGLGDP